MKISYNWLKQFIEIDWPAEKTAALLTDLGLEVEGIDAFESVKGGLEGVVLGEVLSCVKHPNADKLRLCTVDIGQEKPVQIVCGAPNVAKGQKVPVATVGTTLYDAEGNPWKIKKGKIRGEESHGMICAEDELGLGDSHEGIMVLETEAATGTPCSKLFDIERDRVFEIGLTPNRADAMSHFGVARDLKAGLKQKEISKGLMTPSVSNFNVDNRSRRIEVEVKNPLLAPRYCGITLSNLIIQDSPHWLQNRLRAIGLNPINNVVDATNYVLHELGQPLHAFDADRIHGKKVVVRTADPGSKFMTLDGEEHLLEADDLMICDAEKPMCIAGIFGGINTGVTEDTRSIFLESAYFDPVAIRKTAKRLGLSTDASFRFERGVDIENTEYALIRAAVLIRDIAGGEISSDLVDLYPVKMPDTNVFLSNVKIKSLIGTEIPKDTILSILASLEIQVKNVTEAGFGLVIPFYRIDVRREVDVIEEILRVYGYNTVPDKTKFTASILPPVENAPHELQQRIGNRLAALGFDEILGNSLCNPRHNEMLGGNESENVALLNPLSKELSALRRDLLFTGLGAIAHNLNRRQNDLKLFEFGKVYEQHKSGHHEAERLSLLLTGNRTAADWSSKQQAVSFFYLKGVVRNLLEALNLVDFEEQPLKDARFTEALRLSLEKSPIAEFGMVHPKFLKEFDIRQDVYYACIYWEELLKIRPASELSYTEISKFPEVRRDFALLLDQSVTFRQLRDLAFDTERKFLREVGLFDVYTGDKLPEGKKSYALSFVLQDSRKTLTDGQIEAAMSKLQKAFEKELGAALR